MHQLFSKKEDGASACRYHNVACIATEPGKNYGSFKGLFSMGGERWCFQCTDKKWWNNYVGFYLFCWARGVKTSKYNTKIIECVFLMNSMWLHEQGFKKEREIDVHNDYSCRPKPASSVSLSVVAYTGSIKCKTKHVFLVYNSSLQNITHIKLSLAHFHIFLLF